MHMSYFSLKACGQNLFLLHQEQNSRRVSRALHNADSISLAFHINFLQMIPRGQYVECTHLCFDEIFAFISNCLCKSSGLGLFRPFGQGIDLQTIFKLLPLCILLNLTFSLLDQRSQLLSVRKQYTPRWLWYTVLISNMDF